MAWRTLALAIVATVAGCSAPHAPSTGAAAGWTAVPGLDHIEFAANATPTAAGFTFHLTVRNAGHTAYVIHEDCAESWARMGVNDAQGSQVWPAVSQVRCDLCSAGGPCPPAAAREVHPAWDLRDERRDDHGRVATGDYTAQFGVSIDVGGGQNDCGVGPYKSGLAELPLHVA